MTNIKEELMSSYRKAVEDKAKREEESRKRKEVEARHFLEEEIIPMFRQIHSQIPTESKLTIVYIYNSYTECWHYTTNISKETHSTITYSPDSITMATYVANEYGIDAGDESYKGIITFSFTLKFE